MYSEFFKLRENPFSIAPDPRYLYMSRRHQEALAHLLYGVGRGGGFVALTGEVGTGKTTLCRCLLEQLPDDVDIALLLNPRLNAVELLANLCDELEIFYPPETQSLKVLVDRLNAHLLDAHARGRRTVVMIDEAQNLSFEVLEQIRLLTNLETSQTKLLQIILVGQPELNRLLDHKDLRQLRQRITARYHLLPLSLAETTDYICHRLAISGGHGGLFTRSAVRCIYHRSGGIPRLVNILCDRALLGAYARNRHRVTRAIARQAAAEILSPLPAWKPSGRAMAMGAALLVVASSAAGVYYFRDKNALAPASLSFATPQTPAPPMVKPASKPISAADPLAPVPPHASIDPVSVKKGTPPAPMSHEPFDTVLSNAGLTFERAIGALLQRWNVQADNLPGDCNRVRAEGLRCLPMQSTWNELRRLNRPAVLEFATTDGQKRHVALVALESGKPAVALGSKQETFPLEQILSVWEGYYVLLWQPPETNVTHLALGTRSPAVTWLRQRLEPPEEGRFPENLSAYFDPKLKQRVIDFQLSHELEPDGIAGPQTIIHLNNSADTPKIPKLETTGD